MRRIGAATCFRTFCGRRLGVPTIVRGTALAPHDREVIVDVRDGFIVGIFNYCDRWCETCAFTSRCRLFADQAEMDASFDPGMKALVDLHVALAKPSPPPPPWLEELLRDMDEAMDNPADRDEPLERPLPLEHMEIEERARHYCASLHLWLQTRRVISTHDPTDPQAVITRFHTLISAKVHRALHGFADDRPEDREWPPDYDGSAKVALLGIDRSHAAWLELVARGVTSEADIAPFIADLVWLGEALERVFPDARAFVRPGLDEPEEVSRLNHNRRA